MAGSLDTEASNGFLSPLRVEFLDGTHWRVLEPFTYHLATPDGDEYVEVPIDLVTDFASIPRLLWAIWPPTGPYGKAAVVHDRLYVAPVVRTATSARAITREEADAVFLEGMEVLRINWCTRRTLWSAVRIGGVPAWRHYRQTEAAATPGP